ncbi:MAG TPA: uracil-DNA glycosylase [Dehalococcoidia bacterium]
MEPDRVTAFESLLERAAACRRCPDMGSPPILSRRHGAPGARVLFVGEAPGRLGAVRTGVPMTSDNTGRRFGRLLAAAGLRREEVFITNAVLCHPARPDGRNRTPTAREVAACAPWLAALVEAVDAPVVVTLGATALDALRRIEPHPYTLADAGRPVPWRGRTLVPLYHPGPRALIHRPEAAQAEDFRRLGALVRGAAAGGEGAASLR